MSVSSNRQFYALLAALVLSAARPAFAEDGFKAMFDGRTLKGWSVEPPSATKSWRVENGMIVGAAGTRQSYLVYGEKQLADFELRFSYRFPDKGNSGVSIRARKDDTRRRQFQSYHADLGHVGIGRRVLGAWDFHTPGRREHACFRGQRLVIDENDRPTTTKIKGAVTLDDIHRNDWNDVRVIATGNRFRFLLNGKPASEFIEHLPPERRLNKGMILLQLHDSRTVVHFKDLRIKEASRISTRKRFQVE